MLFQVCITIYLQGVDKNLAVGGELKREPMFVSGIETRLSWRY